MQLVENKKLLYLAYLVVVVKVHDVNSRVQLKLCAIIHPLMGVVPNEKIFFLRILLRLEGKYIDVPSNHKVTQWRCTIVEKKSFYPNMLTSRNQPINKSSILCVRLCITQCGTKLEGVRSPICRSMKSADPNAP